MTSRVAGRMSSLPRSLARSRTRSGVLLVGPLSGGPLVGGIETGIDMILRSSLVGRHELSFFNSFNAPSIDRALHRRIWRQVRSFASFERTLLQRRPAVLHVKTAEAVNFWQGIAYATLGRSAGCRVLLQIHGGAFDTWYARQSARAQASIRAALGIPHVLIALSDFWRRFLSGLRPEAAIHVVPNGVELDKARARPSEPRRGLRVTTIGTLGVRKGHFDIVEAAALLRDLDVTFEFVGPDEYGGEGVQLGELARKLGVESRIQLTGPLSGDDKWAALARADVFLLPARNENMPNSVLEAMAAGLPVIATDVGAVAEMLADPRALVPVGDPAAIAAKLRLLHDDEATRSSMGRTNLERATDRYSFAEVETCLDALYSAADRPLR